MEGAYRRTDLFEERRPIIDAWGEYVGAVTSDSEATSTSQTRLAHWGLPGKGFSCPLLREACRSHTGYSPRMADGKLRFGKIVWHTRQQDHSDSGPDPANRIKLQAGTFVEYVGHRSAVRVVVESHDANALLAYRAMWCQRLVEGVSYGVPTPPPGVRVCVESVGATA